MLKTYSKLFLLAITAGMCGCAALPSREISEGKVKKMNFISIVRFVPDDVPWMIAEAKRKAAASGIYKNAYCMSILPRGSNPLAQPERYARAFGELKKGLADSGIEVGILVQSLVGHGWAGANTNQTGMEYSINLKGETAYRQCMLDEKFRDYCRKAITMFAQQKPAFLLMDDDFRTINNGPNGVECFCDSHMKIYEKVLPVKFAGHTELREHLIKAPASDPVVKAFEKYRRESMLDFARLIRSSIDSVDDSIPCGYCSGGGEYILMGDIARALAGKNESFLRINNANYMERGPRDFPLSMYHSAFKSRAAGKLDYILDESDTCPHSRYSKSAISMHAHIVGGMLNGLSGGKLWISSTINNIPQTTRAYDRIMKKYRKFYDVLLNDLKNVTWVGAVTPLIPVDRDFNPARFRDGVIKWNDFQYQIFNWHGLPGRYEYIDGKQVILLTGTIVDSLTDEELKAALSYRALVDGYAAVKIAERNMASYLGCVPEVKPYRTSGEYLRFAPYKMRFQNNFTLPMLTRVAPEAEILSDLKLVDADGTSVIVAPGTICYTNPAGGTVITRANAVAGNAYNIIGEEVKIAMVHFLKKLDPATLPVYCGEELPAYIRCGKRSDGGYMVALVNLSHDAMEEIDLRCAFDVKSVEAMDPDGVYRPLEFRKNPGGILIDRPLACYETIILKLK